ncbi:MAG TPA: cache domain-containing protein [Patescibacteria group bacterium]
MPKKHSWFRNGLIISHIITALLGFFIFIVNYQISQNLLIQNTLNRQLTLAKSGSLSAENLLKSVQSDLASFIFTFAKIPDYSPIDKDATRLAFIAYIQKSELPTTGIALYDDTGKLSIIENRYDIRTGEGMDFSKTELILWAKNPLNKGKTFISSPYIATTGGSVGKIIMVIAEPLYFGNTYKGTLAIRLLVNDFRNAYISPLISGQDDSSFIINTNGIVLAGADKLVGQNIFNYAQTQKWNDYPTFTKSLQTALKQNNTQTTWTFQYPNEKAKDFIVGISKIDLPNTDKDLYLVVLRSKDTTISPLKPILGYGLVWVGLGLLTTIIGSIAVMLLP